MTGIQKDTDRKESPKKNFFTKNIVGSQPFPLSLFLEEREKKIERNDPSKEKRAERERKSSE
jgi:hypothetical protein